MLDKIFDAIVGFMLNRDLEKEIGIRHKLLKGKVFQIPSKILDRFIDFYAKHSVFLLLEDAKEYA